MSLNHGKFFVAYEEIAKEIGIPENSHIELNVVSDGLEIYVVTDAVGENLTTKDSNSGYLRRQRLFKNK